VIGQLHASSTLLSIRDPLTQRLFGHIAGETSTMNLPEFGHTTLSHVAVKHEGTISAGRKDLTKTGKGLTKSKQYQAMG
jgi:hypothetical protein